MIFYFKITLFMVKSKDHIKESVYVVSSIAFVQQISLGESKNLNMHLKTFLCSHP